MDPVSETAPLTHMEVLEYAIRTANESPCQSKRGVVIWDEYGIVSVGMNHQPKPFICDGSDECKRSCGRTAVHAEQMALLHGDTARIRGAQMLHIKVRDGQAVSSDGPSCIFCSKLMLDCGIASMWLLHASGWRQYSCPEFHYLSSHSGDHLVFAKGTL